MKLTAFLEGVGLGALVMFLIDPQQGGRRRALIRDQAVGQLNSKRAALNVMTRDFVNRSRGWQHMVRSRMDRRPVADDVLVERVRAEMGRWTTHPGSIEVMAQDGCVYLSGPVLANEVQDVVRCVRAVPGVRDVQNQMDVHQGPEHVPGLQGQGHLPAVGRWTPSTCLMMGATGLMMTIYGMGRKGVTGGIMQLVGAGMIGKAFYDTENRFTPMQSQRSGGNQGAGQSGSQGNARMSGVSQGAAMDDEIVPTEEISTDQGATVM